MVRRIPFQNVFVVPLAAAVAVLFVVVVISLVVAAAHFCNSHLASVKAISI